MILTTENLQVHILDFTGANKQITEALCNGEQKYYFGAQYCGLIDVNNRFFLVQPNADIIPPQINDVKKPVLLFELDVFELDLNSLALAPLKTANISAADIESLKTGQVMPLRQFMRENFNSSKDVYFNIKNLLAYVNSPAENNKYTIF